MSENPVPITAEGLAKLEKELDELKHVRRPLVAERITPHAEGLASVVCHLLVSHPDLKRAESKWESMR